MSHLFLLDSFQVKESFYFSLYINYDAYYFYNDLVLNCMLVLFIKNIFKR